MSRRVYTRYDPRLKNLVATSEDISKFYRYGIPISTLRQWRPAAHQNIREISRPMMAVLCTWLSNLPAGSY